MHAGEGIFVSNRAFLCRTMHNAVEPGFFVWNQCYNSHPQPAKPYSSHTNTIQYDQLPVPVISGYS